jgi:hypothetical protein
VKEGFKSSQGLDMLRYLGILVVVRFSCDLTMVAGDDTRSRTGAWIFFS